MPLRNLTDLQVFIGVADSGSLSQAAQQNFMSVSTASARVKNLEERLHCQLVQRNSHGLTLTLAGERFAIEARKILWQVEQAQNIMDDFSQRQQNRIRIWANYDASVAFLPHDLSPFLKAWPQVHIQLTTRKSTEVQAAVHQGKTDIGVCYLAHPSMVPNAIPYAVDQLVVIVPASHPLARRNRVSFFETLEYDYVTLQKTSAMQSFLFDQCHHSHKNMKPRIRVDNFLEMMPFILQGVGIGIMPLQTYLSQYANDERLRMLRLTDTWSQRNLYILTNTSVAHTKDEIQHADLVVKLIEHLKRCAQHY